MQAGLQNVSESSDLIARFRTVRGRTEHLCEPLLIEDYVPQISTEASPPKWNIAHTTWFFEEMILKQFVDGYRSFDDNFGFLFNSYYNSVGERVSRDDRGSLTRPPVSRIFEYRNYVDAHIDVLISSNEQIDPKIRDLIILGLNHEQQHQELFLTDIKLAFYANPLLPAYRDGYCPEEEIGDRTSGFVELMAGTYEIGHKDTRFCFDNELPVHLAYIHECSVSKDIVRNQEFLDFIKDGGYDDHRLWHSDGWEWIASNNISAPLYWSKHGEEWFNFTLGGVKKLVMETPVCHVSFYEAAAFAEWKGMRLPTEFEWEVASNRLDWGLRWEWTNSAYLPYPGFRRHDGAVGEYNAKFMVNQMVLRGASIATPIGHSRFTYRNFFQPHSRWQFTGIRLAR